MSPISNRPDYFRLPTDVLDAHLRFVVAAIQSQIAENPGAPAPLQSSVDRLSHSVAEFTTELYWRRP